MNAKIFGRPPVWLAVVVASLASFSALRAQTEVVPAPPTTRLPADPIPPEQVAPVQPAPAVEPLQPTSPAVVPVQPAPAEVLAPGEHVAEISVAVTRGSVQAYFGRAPRREHIGIGDVDIAIKLPSTATVTKLASRDKDSEGARKVTADNPWNARVRFTGPGRYVFNIVEWDDNPAATVLVRVDGQVIFSGHGRDDDFDNWPQKSYAPGVKKSGSREIAFVLD